MTNIITIATVIPARVFFSLLSFRLADAMNVKSRLFLILLLLLLVPVFHHDRDGFDISNI